MLRPGARFALCLRGGAYHGARGAALHATLFSHRGLPQVCFTGERDLRCGTYFMQSAWGACWLWGACSHGGMLFGGRVRSRCLMRRAKPPRCAMVEEGKAGGRSNLPCAFAPFVRVLSAALLGNISKTAHLPTVGFAVQSPVPVCASVDVPERTPRRCATFLIFNSKLRSRIYLSAGFM